MKILFNKWVLLSVCMLIIIGTLLIGKQTDISNPNNKNNFQVSTFIEPLYFKIFTDSAKQIFSKNLELSYNFKNRNPFSLFIYKDVYSIFEYVVSIPAARQLMDIVRMDTLVETRRKKYNVIDIPSMKLYYSSDTVTLINKVILNIYGDSLQCKVKNDSIICIKLHLDNLVIRYDKNKPADIIFTPQNKSHNKLPIELIFLKKGTYLHILLISGYIVSGRIRENLYKDILNLKWN
jgi:hypothetical protein